MSLRYALLALLTAGPATGYDAAKRFHASVGHVWHAPDSQIYPELKRMESDGLVESAEVRWGPRSTKKSYSITGDGVAALRIWMNEPLDYLPERDVVHMRAAYFEWSDPAAVRDNLVRHIDFHQSQIDQWTGERESIATLVNATLARRLAVSDPADHERIVAFKTFAYDGLIARSVCEINWARDGLALLDRLSAAGPADVDDAGIDTAGADARTRVG